MRLVPVAPPRTRLLSLCLILLTVAGVARAEDDPEAELRALIEQQGKEIEDLKKQVESRRARKDPKADAANNDAKTDPADPKIDEGAVKKIVADYLKANPGAGMPPSVQTGYELGRGFAVRSAPNPSYVKWDDDCKIPFELRFRGRLQLAYYNYRVTDRTDHQANLAAGQNANSPFAQANFSQLEVKRLRLVWEGTAFDPNLRYYFELDGNTRGQTGFLNDKVVQNTPTGGFAPNTNPVAPIRGGVQVDHQVRLYSAMISYDFHGCAAEKGCGPECPDGTTAYAPTYTVMAGKMKPFSSFEMYLTSWHGQLVEFAMTDWYFDADDNNNQVAVGAQVRAFDDRLFLFCIVTNGMEAGFPNAQMDDSPGFNVAFWYDFGGSWDAERKRWQLYGDSIPDVDYSCKPVLRVGADAYIAPLDRRSLYGDLEQSRVYVMPGAAQNGTRLINLLTGTTSTPPGSHAVDEFDYYTCEAFAAGHYRGFSLLSDWFFRDLNNFQSAPTGHNQIIYMDSTGAKALFPNGHALIDYGMLLQAGYFIVPKRLEVVARWAWIRGDSGDLNGNGTFKTTRVAGVTGPVRVINGAFTNFHEADEYAVGVNYYFRRHLLKWQSDFNIYEGGNPAGGGQSTAGFIPGSDGWLLRTQLVLSF
jgi:hypothetical protein